MAETCEGDVMLKWKIEGNLIKELSWKECENFINPWGVETADSWSFFSLEKEIGYRNTISQHDVQTQLKSLKQTMKVQFASGTFFLSNLDKLEEASVIRETTLETESEIHLMDFVQRYRFKKSFFQEAEINGQTIKHKNSNVYYQFPVNEVLLKGQKFSLKISIQDVQSTSKFRPTMYVRDRGEEWIVHIRMMPIQDDFFVIKLCSHWFKTSPLPQWISKRILSSEKIKKELIYRSERKPYTSRLMRQISPNAFPMVKLEKDEKLYWKSQMEIV